MWANILKDPTERSRVMEGGEECSSSESGWTMYLASPMHDDDDDDQDDDQVVDEINNVHEDDHGQEEEEDDDEDDGDSMASDASTGPTHSKQSNERGEGGGVVDDGKLCDEKSSKYSSYSCMKSGSKKVEKKKIMYDGKRSTKDVSQNETSAASLYDHKVSKTK
ncbi:hypothetical protein J5N97_008017 [Dioscorea zingiberensis]|uniref:Uncharacterized protein n=1 Tax=Dioscorea zingiberensis TaxID=325984 RepID=A0A9D5DD31_9LILI|nr:hypothetical protein J5N97_008017 [Dioscorea zingiberensis]